MRMGRCVVAGVFLVGVAASTNCSSVERAEVAGVVDIGAIAERTDVAILDAFTVERDYKKAIGLAREVGGPAFRGWRYYGRTRELALQLERRGEDFTTLVLPTRGEWEVLRRGMSRAEQVAYFAKRLRLICVYEVVGVSFADAQVRRVPNGKVGAAPVVEDVVNPFSELKAMALEPKELALLIPSLDDRDFVLAYEGRYSAGSFRHLFRVSTLAGRLINDMAGEELIDLPKYERATAAGQKAMKQDVVEWLRVNEGMTRVELLLRQLREGQVWWWVERAGVELVRAREMSALPVLLARLSEASAADQRAFVLECCYRLAPERCVEAARRWAKEDGEVRFWAAMILFTHGDAETNEGYVLLRELLNGDEVPLKRYVAAFDVLIASGRPGAKGLAEGVVLRLQAMEGPAAEWNGAPFVHRLLLAGSGVAEAYVVRGLSEPVSEDHYYLSPQQRALADTWWKADRVAWMVNTFRKVPLAVTGERTPAERAQEREAQLLWVQEQMRRVRAGAVSEFKAPEAFGGENEWGERR